MIIWNSIEFSIKEFLKTLYEIKSDVMISLNK